jgi:hypothetical protein
MYIGPSDQHASNLALILNINTGHVFDDHIDCVPSTDINVQSKWQDLAHLLDKDAPNVLNLGPDKILKGLKALWYSS